MVLSNSLGHTVSEYEFRGHGKISNPGNVMAEKKWMKKVVAAARFGIISQITNLMILFLMEGRDTRLPCSSKHLINLMPVVAPYSKPTRFMAFMQKFQ